MSFLKFWSSSSKKGGGSGKKDDTEHKHGDGSQDPELEKRRLRHSLSISRSGRFKQRKRERSQIMDKPEIFGGQDDPPTASSSSSSSLASQNQSDNNRNNNSGSSSNNSGAQSHHYHASNSPKFTCRNMNTGTMGSPSGGLRMGHPMVT